MRFDWFHDVSSDFRSFVSILRVFKYFQEGFREISGTF